MPKRPDESMAPDSGAIFRQGGLIKPDDPGKRRGAICPAFLLCGNGDRRYCLAIRLKVAAIGGRN
jgi:hypothetical protein